jgi:hypothetical protein
VYHALRIVAWATGFGTMRQSRGGLKVDKHIVSEPSQNVTISAVLAESGWSSDQTTLNLGDLAAMLVSLVSGSGAVPGIGLSAKENLLWIVVGSKPSATESPGFALFTSASPYVRTSA